MLINLRHNFVMAGEVVVTDKAQTLRTTLGSCAAVIAWHPQKKVGGMGHYLLPKTQGHSLRKPDNFYGELALNNLKFKLVRFAPLRSYQFWLTGGGSMLTGEPGSVLGDSGIAQQNIDMALEWAELNLLTFKTQSVGGNMCRTVSFCVNQGELSIKSYTL